MWFLKIWTQNLTFIFPTCYIFLVFYTSLTISLYSQVFAHVSIIVQCLMLSDSINKKEEGFLLINSHCQSAFPLTFWSGWEEVYSYFLFHTVVVSQNYVKSRPLLLPVFPQGPLERIAGGNLAAATYFEECVCRGYSKIIRKPRWGAWFPLWALTKYRTSVP